MSASRKLKAVDPVLDTSGPRAPSATAAPEAARFSRVQWIVDVLTERIIDGTYGPGERIREAVLQQEFGFSNGPIREALQRLVADGLAVRSPWQGVRVVELSEDDVVALFELRGALLERAAVLAARNSRAETAKSAARLRQTLAGKFSAARAGRVPVVTGDTTDWVMEVAGNSFISDAWQKTMLKSRIYVYRSMQKTAGAGTEPIIDSLIEAIVQRKPLAARRAAAALTHQMLADLGLSRARSRDD